jgi:flagellar FliL protein
MGIRRAGLIGGRRNPGAVMSTAAAADHAEAPAKKGGKKKLILLAAPVLLGVIGAGLWFGGILPPLLGMGGAAHAEGAQAEAGKSEGGKPEGGKGEAAKGEGAKGEGGKGEGGKGEAAGGAKSLGPVYVDIPEIIANLNAGPRRTMFLKLHAKLELSKAEDQTAVTAALPRLIDLFQTYLREMRPDELRGAAGTYRLREELIARADIVTAPAQVVDVLFVEMLVQ